MKFLLLLSLSAFLLPYHVIAQSAKTEKAIAEISPYEIDNNGYVTWTRIIEADSISKDVLFNRAQEYFTYNYGDGESVIQINDRESGRVIGKGRYNDTGNFTSVAHYSTDTWHILRIDVKDGKAKISISLVEYEMTLTGMNGDRTDYKDLVSDEYPINKKATLKNVYGQAFVESFKRASKSMDELEKSLKGGVSDW